MDPQFDSLIGVVLMGLIALLFGGAASFSNKKKEKKLVDLEVKGAHDDAKNKVADKSLADLVADNNKRYGSGKPDPKGR